MRLELAERAQSSLESELAAERQRWEEAETARAQREIEERRGRLEAERRRAERVGRPETPVVPQEPREVGPRAPETPAQVLGTGAAGGEP